MIVKAVSDGAVVSAEAVGLVEHKVTVDVRAVDVDAEADVFVEAAGSWGRVGEAETGKAPEDSETCEYSIVGGIKQEVLLRR